MKNEEWRFIEKFPAYEVSNYGNVRRVFTSPRNPGCHILKHWTGIHGYAMVCLCNSKGKIKMLVHRLVCEAFHGKAPTNSHQVAHGDGTRTNNNADNLRWATRSENMEDARMHGTMALGSRHGRTLSPEKNARGEKHGHSKLKETDIEYIRSYDRSKGSGVYLASIYGVSTSTICMIRSGKTWNYLLGEKKCQKC